VLMRVYRANLLGTDFFEFFFLKKGGNLSADAGSGVWRVVDAPGIARGASQRPRAHGQGGHPKLNPKRNPRLASLVEQVSVLVHMGKEGHHLGVRVEGLASQHVRAHMGKEVCRKCIVITIEKELNFFLYRWAKRCAVVYIDYYSKTLNADFSEFLCARGHGEGGHPRP
jgi:hypothetical protein